MVLPFWYHHADVVTYKQVVTKQNPGLAKTEVVAPSSSMVIYHWLAMGFGFLSLVTFLVFLTAISILPGLEPKRAILRSN